MRVRRRPRPDRASALRAIPLLERCTDAELRRVERIVVEIDVAPGEVVASERDAPAESYVIASGEASVVLREHSVDRLGPGGVFGELALLFPGRPPAATVTAITHMQVLVVDRRDLAELVAIPSVAQQLAADAVFRLRTEGRLPCR
jgi:CRP-like cAMP-binding protein